MDLKNQIEAILFAAGKRVELSEISKLTKAQESAIKQAISELLQKHNLESSPLLLTEENNGWKLTVKEDYLPLVQTIVTETELDKSTMETLAVIAWKYPILQSEVIKMRTNKAYEHLSTLEEAGFVERVKFGRTKKIKLTDKFFTYFSLPNHSTEEFKKLIPQEIKNSIESREKQMTEQERKIIDAQEKKREEIKLKDKKGKFHTLEQYQTEVASDTPILAATTELGMNVYNDEPAIQTPIVDAQKDIFAQTQNQETIEEAEPTPEVEQEDRYERETQESPKMSATEEQLFHPRKENEERNLDPELDNVIEEIEMEKKKRLTNLVTKHGEEEHKEHEKEVEENGGGEEEEIGDIENEQED